jgi:glutamate-1-semialdehyde 2,1-aminomutase
MAAGIATLQALAAPGFYDALEAKSARLANGIENLIARHELPARINRAGSLMTLFLTDAPVFDYASARQADAQRYARFFHALLERGVYLPPSQYEAMFVSAAHTDADIDETLAAIDAALEA